jgi:transaldolase/glucose-6-phosphate isomerase
VSGNDPTLTVQAWLPAALEQVVADKLAQAARERVAERMRLTAAGGPQADPTLWGPAGTPEIANRLGWLTIAERMLAQADAIESFAAEIRREGVRDVVLLGMGGSSLAAEVMRRSYGPQDGWPTLHVLDSTDSDAVRAVERAIDPRSALFLVSSKSGGTIEPLSMLAHFWPLTGERGASFVAITDPGSGLEQLAAERGFRRTFHGDPDIGGRYSALSAFGIVPAALMGIDIKELLTGGMDAWNAALRATFTEHDTETAEHGGEDSNGGKRAGPSPGATATVQEPAWLWLGATFSALAQNGHDKLTLLVSGALSSLGLWTEQLVAESTGKQGTGILPVAEEPLGAPDAYGEDRVFLHLPDLDAPDAELAAAAQRLAQAGHPLIEIPTRGPAELGRIFALAELDVAIAGWGLGINPFNQPDVQLAKDATNAVLDEFKAGGELPAAAEADDDALVALLRDAGAPHYVAIMGYTQPSPTFDAAVAELRAAIRTLTRATTTFGYGPRFLHSTGQFHKGGPPVGRFLQLLHDGPEDVPIPESPYGFTTLKNAQALGDERTLRKLGLPVARVRLQGADPAASLRALTRRIEGLL